MYFTELLSSDSVKSSFWTEANNGQPAPSQNLHQPQPQPQQSQPQDQYQDQGQDMGMDGMDQTPKVIEFQNLKKYILLDRVKLIKKYLDTSDIDKSDPAIDKIFEFINLVLMFFNSFTYPEAVTLVDNLIDSIEETIKIKLPVRTPQEPAYEE